MPRRSRARFSRTVPLALQVTGSPTALGSVRRYENWPSAFRSRTDGVRTHRHVRHRPVGGSVEDRWRRSEGVSVGDESERLRSAYDHRSVRSCNAITQRPRPILTDRCAKHDEHPKRHQPGPSSCVPAFEPCVRRSRGRHLYGQNRTPPERYCHRTTTPTPKPTSTEAASMYGTASRISPTLSASTHTSFHRTT